MVLLSILLVCIFFKNKIEFHYTNLINFTQFVNQMKGNGINMYTNQKLEYRLLLQALINKFGLFLTPEQCAEVLCLTERQLAERRRNKKSVPKHIYSNCESNIGIIYAVQDVVEYQLKRREETLKSEISA